jgi:hypothetical protein
MNSHFKIMIALVKEFLLTKTIRNCFSYAIFEANINNA